jgi:hypothetical protein
MKFHPYSEIFPLLQGAALDELAADIKANGLREDIWLYDGQILDGRNRFLACQKAKIRPVYRKYIGKEPLAFVVSLNIQRRHLSDSQRAMAAARIATMQQGARTDLASRDAKSQRETASNLDVSRSSVQRAKKVIEEGSKALQQAVESGDVPLRKAAAVVDLPKSEQLAAAKKKPEKPVPAINLDEQWHPDADEEAAHEGMEKEYAASIDKVMEADDRLSAARAEIKRQAAEIAVLKLARDGYMNERLEAIRLCKKLQRECDRLRQRSNGAARHEHHGARAA